MSASISTSAMANMNDDVMLVILALCDIATVVVCRAVSQYFKRIIDEKLALQGADFSTLTFLGRRLITDAAVTPTIAHILRRAVVINLNGTSVSHRGAMKLVTDFTKELHVERCTRINLRSLTKVISDARSTSGRELFPVRIYTRTRGLLDYSTVKLQLYNNSFSVIMLSKVCACGYIDLAAPIGRLNQPVGVDCHMCVKLVEYFSVCPGCALVACEGCKVKSCSNTACRRTLCKGCVSDERCPLCAKVWCGSCQVNVAVMTRCHGCDTRACSECRPKMSKCLKCRAYYCEECTGMMPDQCNKWCCENSTPVKTFIRAEY